MSYYYNIENDIKKFPEAFIFIIVGGRSTGKTYGTLKSCYLNKRDFIFLKRTIEDVELLTSGTGKVGTKNEFGIDLSPFKSINRDLHSDVKAYSIRKGLGVFYDHFDDGEIKSTPIGYLLALNAVSKYKGFDLASSKEEQWLIFDEFIPMAYDRINRKEGEQLLDLYKTVSRDREHRNLTPLKLICLANATSINNPTMEILEITDTVAAMQLLEEEYHFIKDRGILIHILPDQTEFSENEKKTAMYKAMKDTAWSDVSFGNKFAYNDFSSVGKQNLKGYRPLCTLIYKRHKYFIYSNSGHFYMCRSRHISPNIYNLDKENDQKRFFFDYLLELREACIDDRFKFETYSMYDLIINYKKHFILS